MKKIVISLLTLALALVLVFVNTISVLADAPTTSTEDITPPIVSDITLEKTTIETPGKIGIVIGANDDVSGVHSISITFTNQVTGKDLYANLYGSYGEWVDNQYKEIVYSDGKFHGTIEADQHTGSGEYIVKDVYVSDKAGNSKSYFGKGHRSYDYYLTNSPDVLLSSTLCGLKLSVTNSGTEDILPPTVSDITLEKTTIETPGKIGIVIGANDDVSGVHSISITFTNQVTDKDLYANLYGSYGEWVDNQYKEIDYSDGKFHGTIEVDQYAGSGEYIVKDVYVSDKAGNSKSYFGKGHRSYDYYLTNSSDTLLSNSLSGLKVTVVNTGKTPDIVTTTASINFINEIANVVDDGNIVADFSNNPDISSDVFTTIAGTNKEVTFTSSGISWQFNGADVNPSDAKNINLAVDIKTADQDTTPAGESIKELAGEESSALILHFADNGQLPGKATIRVKADYVLRNYLGSTGLNVYFWDSINNVLVPIASNVSIDNNGDILFDITHCSYYVIVGRQEGSAPAIYDPTVAFIECDEESYSENYIDDLIWQLEEIAEEGTVQTIIWNQGTALPEGVMSFLKDHPKLTLIFNYSYEGKEYSITIPGSKAIVDPEIPWYGPMWLYAHYSGSVVSKNGTATKSGVYIVQAGDTLNKIAQSKGVTLEHIKSHNPSIKDVNRIFIGQSINY